MKPKSKLKPVRLRWNPLHRMYQGTDGGMYDQREAAILKSYGVAIVTDGPQAATS